MDLNSRITVGIDVVDTLRGTDLANEGFGLHHSGRAAPERLPVADAKTAAAPAIDALENPATSPASQTSVTA